MRLGITDMIYGGIVAFRIYRRRDKEDPTGGEGGKEIAVEQHIFIYGLDLLYYFGHAKQ